VSTFFGGATGCKGRDCDNTSIGCIDSEVGPRAIGRIDSLKWVTTASAPPTADAALL